MEKKRPPLPELIDAVIQKAKVFEYESRKDASDFARFAHDDLERAKRALVEAIVAELQARKAEK